MGLLKDKGLQSLIEGVCTEEEKMKKAYEEWERTFDAISDFVFILDNDSRFVRVNKAICDFLRKEPKELIGKHCFEVLHNRDKPWPNCPHQKMLATNKVAIGEINDPNFGPPLLVTASPIFDDKGEVVGSVHLAKDITERKRTEEVLRKSEERFRNIFENASDAMVYLDKSGKIRDFNRKALQVFGGSREELLGKHFTKVGVFSPREIPRLMGAFAKVLAGKEGALDMCFKNKQGEKKYLECSTSLMKMDSKLAGMMVSARDVTERKKAEERLRESEERYRVLVESAPDAIFTLNEAGDFFSANRAAAKALGKTPENLVGKNLYDLFPKEEADAHMKSVKAVFQTGNPVISKEIQIQTKFELRWYNATIMPIRDNNGKIIYVMGISREITEKKMMEEKLKEYTEHLEEMVSKRTRELRDSEEKYRKLFENANDALVHVSLTGKILDMNRRAEEIAGWKKEEVVGKHFARLGFVNLKDVPKLLSLLKRKIQGKSTTAIELTITRKDGEKKFLEINSARIRENNLLQSILAVVRDITERKRMEEQLLKTERLAAIGELATMVGHDLRNPLQSIENATYVIQNELSNCARKYSASIPHKAMEMLQVIVDSADCADRIIRDLQDFSTTRKPTLKKTDVNAIVKEVLSQVEVPENVELVTELSSLPEIKVDIDMIKRVFMNMVVNGIQALRNKGTLKISTRKTKDFVEVSFKDIGVGIAKKDMEKIFTPFFTTKAKGMGMGLPICQKFVEIHDGSIDVESEEGKGSTFTVKLPIQQKKGGENQ